ncbi:hypothetical protein BpHYR1_039746 [Brachionus plicatilis]|uniref:Uncharacterized protein n=1 Tax=Brachionus plicatilis TaxID=10195 RepID=A0A3M7T6K4_BRAPC|nr:hypothetical protein BpHYR1_039746 [Brachionus plicatilis]
MNILMVGDLMGISGQQFQTLTTIFVIIIFPVKILKILIHILGIRYESFNIDYQVEKFLQFFWNKGNFFGSFYKNTFKSVYN